MRCRASVEDKWNLPDVSSIVDPLTLRQVDLYKQGEWCSPAELFDAETKFEVGAQSRCVEGI